MMTTNATVIDRIVPTSEIVKRANLSRSSIIRLEHQGLFPKRQLLGLRKKGLPESVFTAWLASRAPADKAQ